MKSWRQAVNPLAPRLATSADRKLVKRDGQRRYKISRIGIEDFGFSKVLFFSKFRSRARRIPGNGCQASWQVGDGYNLA